MPSKHIAALMLGTLALGIAEFSMMSILSIVAADLSATIPQAGHFIASYAIGVCAGVCAMVLFARRTPLKKILLAAAFLMFIGNALSSLAAGYFSMTASRFIAGLPHGVFFGAGSIVAASLAAPGHQSRDVCLMVAGMTFANLVGVPLASFLSWNFSWRIDFALVSLISLAALISLWKWVPEITAQQDAGFKNQFKFLTRPQPWLVLGAIMLGNGGFFSFYSYVNPIIEDVSLIPAQYMSAVITAAGFGMIAGNLLSAKLSIKNSNEALASIGHSTIFVGLVLLFAFAANPYAAVALTMLVAGCVFFSSGPLQVLILTNAKEGQLLAAALAQCAFNAGNAFGAWIGGLPIEAGRSAEWSALPGIFMSAVGAACLISIYSTSRIKKKERND